MDDFTTVTGVCIAITLSFVFAVAPGWIWSRRSLMYESRKPLEVADIEDAGVVKRDHCVI